jgi:hypothetical protein
MRAIHFIGGITGTGANATRIDIPAPGLNQNTSIDINTVHAYD